MRNIQIDGIGMEVTDAIKSFIEKKFEKIERFEDKITNIKVRCKESISSKGIDKDFKVEVTIDVPNTIIRAERAGSDLYAIIDEIVDIIVRKLNRYKDLFEHWKTGKLEDNYYNQIEEHKSNDYYIYEPKVSKRKTIDYCAPMSESEAIERMELTDLNFYLFRNSKTDKWSVVYRREDGTYGIIEPSCN